MTTSAIATPRPIKKASRQAANPSQRPSQRRPKWVYRYNPTTFPACEKWYLSVQTHGLVHLGSGNFTVEASTLRIAPARMAQLAPKEIILWNPKTGGRRTYKSEGGRWSFASEEGGTITVFNS